MGSEMCIRDRYRVVVRARYADGYVEASGGSGVAILVVDELYDVGATISRVGEETKLFIQLVNETLSKGITGIVEDIQVLSDRTVVIDTKLGEITGTLVEVNDNLLSINTTAGVILVRVDNLRSDLREKIDKAKQEILEGVDTSTGEVEESLNTALNETKSSIEQSAKSIQIMIGILYVAIGFLGMVWVRLAGKK